MIINVGEGVASKAQAVKYDNTDSKLTATNTQGAIDEVVTKVNNKVEKESGKGLSTNDYTTTEKSKLAGIAEGATNNVVDTSLSTSSTNAIQNKAVASALNNKVTVVSGKGLSTNDYTNDEKTKLAGIATGANKTIVDSSLNTSSTNPVQNKVVATKFNEVSGNLGKVKSVTTNVSFSNGKGTYTDSSITTNSRLIASRVLTGSAGVFIAGAKAYNGYCEVFMSSGSSGGTETLTIFIDNR